jgi:hypothetical protein
VYWTSDVAVIARVALTTLGAPLTAGAGGFAGACPAPLPYSAGLRRP